MWTLTGIFPLFFFMFCHEDLPGWDGGRSNGFVNGIHANRMSGGFGGRGAPRNDRGGSGAWVGQRGGAHLIAQYKTKVGITHRA